MTSQPHVKSRGYEQQEKLLAESLSCWGRVVEFGRLEDLLELSEDVSMMVSQVTLDSVVTQQLPNVTY